MKVKAKGNWLIMAILFAILAASCQSPEEPTPTPIPTSIIPEKPTYVVQRGTVIKSLHFTGRITPVREERLFFKANGYVKRVLVEEGDWVKKGELLAELEMSELERQFAQAQLELEAARLRLEEAKKEHARKLAQAKVELDIARYRLAQAKAQDPAPRVAAAKANLDKAAADLQRAQADYDAVAWSPQLSRGPAEALDEATYRYQLAKAQYEEALQEQEAFKYRIRILEEEVKLAEPALKELEERIDPLLEKEVERAALTVETLKAQLDEARIYAPFDGQILSVTTHPGKYVEAFKPIIIIADPAELEISAELSGEQLQELDVGQTATIVLADYPEREFHGYVRRLPYPFGTVENLDEVDRTVRISFDPEGVDLEIGALAKVTVEIERKENVLYLPSAAIRTFGGRKFVVVKEGEVQRRVDVKLGIEGEDRVEILEGLEEGQIVVGQ